MLSGIDVRLNTDFFTSTLPECRKIIYTGPIDKFFKYEFGKLEYKTTKFIHEKKLVDNFQGTAMMNFTDKEVPYTRIIEHKHFEDVQTPSTWITYEYPELYNNSKEPYYPVNDQENNFKYKKYKEKADTLENIYFGGRLAEYKYYDMDDVIESALTFISYL